MNNILLDKMLKTIEEYKNLYNIKAIIINSKFEGTLFFSIKTDQDYNHLYDKDKHGNWELYDNVTCKKICVKLELEEIEEFYEKEIQQLKNKINDLTYNSFYTNNEWNFKKHNCIDLTNTNSDTDYDNGF